MSHIQLHNLHSLTQPPLSLSFSVFWGLLCFKHPPADTSVLFSLRASKTTDPDAKTRVEAAEAETAASAEVAAAASPENAAAAAATAAKAKEAAEEKRRGVPRSARARGVWICGAALGSEGYIKAKLKEVQIRLCGQEDSDGALLTTLKELSEADQKARADLSTKMTPHSSGISSA